MSADNYKTVLFNDGEGVTHTDLNDIQKFAQAQVWEKIWHESISGVALLGGSTNDRDPGFAAQDGTDHPTHWAYAPNPGRAYLRPGSANNKIKIAPGVLLQKTNTLDGNSSKILSFTFAGTDEFTFANGDPSSPRVDLLQMSLTEVSVDTQSRDFEDAVTRVLTSTTPLKKTRVECALSVKQGTPAASPVIPDPDSGCCAVGAVVVGQTWTSAGNAPVWGLDVANSGNVIVYDLRMPLGIRPVVSLPSDFYTVLNWTLSAQRDLINPSNATNQAVVLCKGGTGTARLVALETTHFSGTLGVRIGQYHWHGTLPGAVLTDMYTVSTNFNNGADLGRNVWAFPKFESLQTPDLGATVLPSAVLQIGPPIWTNGRHTPYEQILLSATPYYETLMAHFVNVATPTTLGPITFWIAGGL